VADTGKHILVAEDEAAFRFSASLALRMAGYRVTGAKDGMDALEELIRLKEEGIPVDLLVTDLRMPNLSGAGLVAAMRRHDILVPVFVVSGYIDPQALRELALTGCVGQIEKPLLPDELVRCVERVMKKVAA
jgi:two-component system chemotaxis response regulator CheY